MANVLQRFLLSLSKAIAGEKEKKPSVDEIKEKEYRSQKDKDFNERRQRIEKERRRISEEIKRDWER
jgi:hypothetical protein